MAATQADRRRFNAPESHPIQYHANVLSSRKGKEVEKRADDREIGNLRPIFLKTGLITQASGSAYIETGHAKLVCAVYGPHPIRRDAPFSSSAQLNVEVRYAPFACRDRHETAGRDTEASHLAAKLEQALKPSLRLDLLPKSVIDLFVVVLECDGPMEDISSGITASSVALAEAGVEMFGLVVGACAAIRPKDQDVDILIDPTTAEAKSTNALVGLSSIPAMGTITNLTIEGELAPMLIKQTLEQLNKISVDIHAVSSKVLRDGVQT